MSHRRHSALPWRGSLLKAPLQWLIDAALARQGRLKASQIRPHVVGQCVLDLGCAEGYVGDALQSDRCRVTLADVVDLNRTTLQFYLYDGVRLPFADDSFDTVILSLVLHHAQSPAVVLRESARVARQRVIVTESTFETRWDRRLLAFLDGRVNRLRAGKRLSALDEHIHHRSVPEWRRLFARAELTLLRERWLSRLIHKHILFELAVAAASSEPRRR